MDRAQPSAGTANRPAGRRFPLDERPGFSYQTNIRSLLSASFSRTRTPDMQTASRITSLFTALALLVVSVVVVVRTGIEAP